MKTMLFSSRKFNYRKRFLIQISLSGLFLIFLICLSFFFIHQIKLTSQRVEAKKFSLEGIQNENERIAQLRLEYKEAQPYFSQVNSFSLTTKEVIDVLSSIETVAKQTNNVVRIDMIEEKQINEQIQSLKYQISLRGNMKSFLDYSKRFEELPAFLKIEEVDISIPSGDNEEGTMLHRFFLFSKKDKEEIYQKP